MLCCLILLVMMGLICAKKLVTSPATETPYE